jgi:hypothetical protein
MPLTVANKMTIRRHLKFPVAGNITGPGQSPTGGTVANGFVGYRWFQAYGALEFKMNNLAPVEEAAILGLPYGAAAFVGPQPNPGDTVSMTITSTALSVSPQIVTTTVPTGPLPPYPNATLQLIQALVQQIALNQVLVAAGFVSLAPYGTGPFNQNAVPVPELSVTAPAPFTITGAGSGQVIPQITANGILIGPSASLDGGCTTLSGYLALLNGLESAYLGASDNLDTNVADVWKRNPNEVGARRSLYENQVALFGDFMGLAPYRDAAQRPKRSGAIQYV